MNIFDTELFPYFEGDSIVGTEVPLKMTSIFFEDMPDHKGNKVTKVTLGFQGSKKRLVLNKTNAKRIALIHGPDTDSWKGKQITLITERVQAFGKTHNAVRIKVNAAQSNALFETPEIDPVTDVELVESDVWLPAYKEFIDTCMKDFKPLGWDKSQIEKILKDECQYSGFNKADASEMYNCLARIFGDRREADKAMPAVKAIEKMSE